MLYGMTNVGTITSKQFEFGVPHWRPMSFLTRNTCYLSFINNIINRLALYVLVKKVSHITKAATAGAGITEAAATAAPRSLFLKASWENDDWMKGATFSRPHPPFPHVHNYNNTKQHKPN